MAKGSERLKKKLTKHADPVEVIEVTPDIIPEPISGAVHHYAILLAVIVVGLFPTPGRSLHHVARDPPPRPRRERRLFLRSHPDHLILIRKMKSSIKKINSTTDVIGIPSSCASCVPVHGR